MSKPYDSTAKDILQTDPVGWVRFLGVDVDPSAVQLVDADVSTITAEADKVILVQSPSPWILHLEFQTHWENALGRRVLRYNAILHHRHEVPVASVVVLLRETTNPDAFSGLHSIQPPIGRPWQFPFEVLRVWERPALDFLNASLGLLPLAPIGAVKESDLPVVLKSMQARLSGRADPALAAKLWTATYVLMGLRYDPAVIDNVLSGVLQMEESVTYQAIMNRGRQEGFQQGAFSEVRTLLQLIGEKRLGPPSATVNAAIDAISEKAALEKLVVRVTTASSWDEALKPE